MFKECGIQGYKTNHSLRATAASRLYASGMDEQLVMERTGHRSTEGVPSYKRTSMQQKQEVSDILNMATRIKTNTTNQTGDFTNSAVANVSFPSSCSTKTGAFNFHSCTNVNLIFNNNTDK